VEKTTKRVALWSVLLTKYSGDQIKENEIGGSCGTYRGEKGRTQGFGGET
jgi:hypothetical protein